MNTTSRPRRPASAPAQLTPLDPLPSFTPGEPDAVLLAFVLSEDDSLDGWREWQRLIPIENVAGTTHDLLPALYKRIEALGYDGPEVARLRGIYRHQWTRNQRHRTAATAATEALTQAGVVYLRPWDQVAADLLDEPGVLPLRTPRITVPYERSGAAIEALHSTGWTVAPAEGTRSLHARLVQTDWELEHPAGHGIVLANHYNPRLRDRVEEREVWRRSTAGEGSERRVAPSDLLFAALTDSIGHAPALRWAIATHALLPVLEANTGGRVSLDPQLATRVARYLLRPLETRLAYLAPLEPHRTTIPRALEAARSELATPDPRLEPEGNVRHTLQFVPHLAEASLRLIRRFGGPRGTLRYLRATREG